MLLFKAVWIYVRRHHGQILRRAIFTIKDCHWMAIIEQICHVLWVIRPTNFHVQGVPRNKTEARRLEGCLYVLLKLATFICQPYFSSKILEFRIQNIPISGIFKVWSAFFVLSILPEILTAQKGQTTF